MITDEQRVSRAVQSGRRMLGPVERQRCERHPRRWIAFRWTWRVDDDITGADAEVVRSCAECTEEDM